MLAVTQEQHYKHQTDENKIEHIYIFQRNGFIDIL